MRIFYDVDTQNDFMNKDGALYVPDAELIKPNLKLLTDYARKNYIPVIGSVDRHFGTEEYKERELELARWGGPFPDHCMDGTFGQKKIKETKNIISSRGEKLDGITYIRHRLNEKIDYELLGTMTKMILKYKEASVFFEKQNYDVFTNPATAYFLETAKVKEAVVYGVATDYCVKVAILGMQNRRIQCYVVEDTIKGVAQETTKQALEEMVKAGAKFIKTKEVLGGNFEK